MKAASKTKYLAAALLLPVLLLVVIFGALTGSSSAASSPSGTSAGTLDPSKVPAQYVQAFVTAGQTCPAVSAPLLAAQAEAESGMNPEARSPAGAEGFSQFLPSTWSIYGIDGDGDGIADIWNAVDSIFSQANYDCALAATVASVPGDPTQLMLAAYNAGPGAVLLYNGVPPYPETQAYVARIMSLTAQYSAPVVPPSGSAGDIVSTALSFIGTPYQWGGDEPGGFDCSGLTSYSYLHGAGITIPRTSPAQHAAAVPVPAGQEQPGDLVFFGSPVHHVGIVVDPAHSIMVDAPHTGANVRTEDYTTWSDLVGFGRFT